MTAGNRTARTTSGRTSRCRAIAAGSEDDRTGIGVLANARTQRDQLARADVRREGDEVPVSG